LTPIALGRSRSTSGTVTVVPELRSYRYEPKPARLSPMQMLVVQLVCCGLADKEIAFVLGVSSATVKAHMSRAIKDMGLSPPPAGALCVREWSLRSRIRAG
jgi:DNA-binding NarL/FixJ family response regulator